MQDANTRDSLGGRNHWRRSWRLDATVLESLISQVNGVELRDPLFLTRAPKTAALAQHTVTGSVITSPSRWLQMVS